MDKLLIRKDVYEDMIEKGYGKRDLSKLTKKKVTDKNGHTRTVYVRNGEQPATQQQPKAQDELTPEKKARYEEMLEQVKAGPEENALFVKGKGMLNKKDAIAHLEGKLGKKTETKLTQNDTKEKVQATRTSKADKEESEFNSKEEVKANLYKKVEFTPKEMKAIREEAKRINYKPGMENSLLIALKNRNDGTSGSLYFKNREIWNKTGMVKDTNSDYDLIKKKIKSMNGDFGADENRTSSEETEKKSSQKETFKSKTEKYKKMGLDDRASAAIVAIAEIEDEIRKTPDSDVKKLDELAALRTDVQLNGLKSKYVKQRMEEDFNNSDEGKEKTKRKDDFKSKMSKFKKWGLDDRAAAASVAIDEIEDLIRNTPDEEKDKLEELAALRTDVQLNGLNSKYIKEILG